VPEPIAHWNSARDAWETTDKGLFCEHSDVFSETWPTSGMTLSGTAYALPTSEPPTTGSGSSSLLPTPAAADGERASTEYPRGNPTLIGSLLPTPDATHGRKTTRTGLLLPGVVETLLPTPTPTVSDANGPGKHGTGGTDLRTAVHLLPTPRATDGTKGGPNQRGSSGDLMLPSAVQNLMCTPTGGSTPPPSDAGSPPSDAPHPIPLWPDSEEDDD
jgi:hypothetical protein